jgi:hypothetical protein
MGGEKNGLSADGAVRIGRMPMPQLRFLKAALE